MSQAQYISWAGQYKDPRWQRKRLEIMKRDDWTCRECRASDGELHAHHRSYVAGRAPWEYEDDELVTLCEPCHSKVTFLVRSLRYLIGHQSITELRTTWGFLAGEHCHRTSRGIRFTSEIPEGALSGIAIGAQCTVKEVRLALGDKTVLSHDDLCGLRALSALSK